MGNHLFKKGLLLRSGIYGFGLLATIFMASCFMTMQSAWAGNDVFEPLQKRLQSDGFDVSEITALYSRPETQFDMRSISLFFLHSESKLNYDQFLAPESVAKAARYMQEHADSLAKAESALGVDKEVITAIILVETRLGTYLGNSYVFNTLSSMAALRDPILRQRLWDNLPKERRIDEKRFRERVAQKSQWAYTELKAFLVYASRHGIDPTRIRGSYAGAMGISQFMPSNILAYARDGDQDGRIDLFEHPDAIMSIASYLKHFGWRQGIDRSRAEAVIYRYNHSKYYVQAILGVADRLKESG